MKQLIATLHFTGVFILKKAKDKIKKALKSLSEQRFKNFSKLSELLCSVFVFDTVFFVETIDTTICLGEFLTPSVEWM